MHFVLSRHTPFHEVDIAGTVDGLGEFARLEDPLLALEDVEIVVGGVKTGVPFGSKWGSENDQVLGDRGVDDVHCAHRAPGVVENPLR